MPCNDFLMQGGVYMILSSSSLGQFERTALFCQAAWCSTWQSLQGLDGGGAGTCPPLVLISQVLLPHMHGYLFP